MKLTKYNKIEIKKMHAETARDAKTLLTQNGARLSLVAAFVYIAASAGSGIIASYLPMYFLEQASIILSEAAEYALMITFAYFFAAPAIAGMRHVASSLCDGREVSISEIFTAFSSLGRFCASFLGSLTLFLRYAVAVLIIYLPDLVANVLFPDEEEIPFYFYAISLVTVLVATLLWLMLTRKLNRLFYYLWSRRMNYFKALGALLKQKYIPRSLSPADFLNIILSVATCFVYYIIQAGPLFAIEYELAARRNEAFSDKLKLEKLRKDGQK